MEPPRISCKIYIRVSFYIFEIFFEESRIRLLLSILDTANRIGLDFRLLLSILDTVNRIGLDFRLLLSILDTVNRIRLDFRLLLSILDTVNRIRLDFRLLLSILDTVNRIGLDFRLFFVHIRYCDPNRPRFLFRVGNPKEMFSLRPNLYIVTCVYECFHQFLT